MMDATLGQLIRRCRAATGGNFSDLQAREGDWLRIRTTRGIEPLDEEGALTRSEIVDFLGVVAPQLKVDRELEAHHGELDFGFDFDGDTYRANLTYFDGRKWLALVMRKLDKQIRTLAQLGLRESLLKWLDRDSGLIFVVGPTGSGKSSTLASMIEYLNRERPIHVLTIEDPIEFRFQQRRATITQREVGVDTPDFATAARNALREDPDVILIGEVRDIDSARECLRLAETGHLVLASMHADSAVGAIDRFSKLVQGAAEHHVLLSTLGSHLIGVIYQTLLTSTHMTEQGLPKRQVAYETIANTPSIASHIRDDRIIQIPAAVEMSGVNENNVRFERVVDSLVKQKLIDDATALRALSNHDRSREQETEKRGAHA
jgi:twitching motility protein PilT